MIDAEFTALECLDLCGIVMIRGSIEFNVNRAAVTQILQIYPIAACLQINTSGRCSTELMFFDLHTGNNVTIMWPCFLLSRVETSEMGVLP